MQNMKMKHYVSETSTPTNQELNQSLEGGALKAVGLAPSRNLADIFLHQFQQMPGLSMNQGKKLGNHGKVGNPNGNSPEQQNVRFRENQIS